jgi:hypothetical protein
MWQLLFGLLVKHVGSRAEALFARIAAALHVATIGTFIVRPNAADSPLEPKTQRTWANRNDRSHLQP